jgi:hypothetical protein
MTERFTLLEEVGRGGMGVVWKARDEETGRVVALKLMRDYFAEDPDYVARFERELDLATRIESEHVVRVLGFGVRKRSPYLALEYVDGPALSRRLSESGPMDWPSALDATRQIALGLAAAHKRDVIHRDVKPSNVLIAPDGTLKITDFGIARGLDQTRLTATSAVIGTPTYLAPEGPADERSDLYSLGVITYELLAGCPPFTGRTYQDVLVAHIRTSAELDRIPAEARPIVGWLLAKEPADRPHHATDLLAVLDGRLVLPHMAPRSGQKQRLPEAVHTTPAPLPGSAGLSGSESPGRRGGSWRPKTLRNGRAGAMARPRVWHAASVLPDGTVLVAGGWGGYQALRESEIYDPRTGDFRIGPALLYGRHECQLVGLSDGRILCADGSAAPEIYDAQRGGFSPAARWNLRDRITFSQLPGGRVLIVGGWPSGPGLDAYVYDPDRGVVGAAPTIIQRERHTATPLADGRVLLAGGSARAGEPLDSLEIFDPASGSFTPANSLLRGRTRHTATLLKDSRVLVAGGAVDQVASATTDLFDPESGRVRRGPSLKWPREHHTAILRQDGSVLFIGGKSQAGWVTSVELFEPDSNRVFEVGSTSPRTSCTATVLPGGSVLVVGGLDPSGRPLHSAELLL